MGLSRQNHQRFKNEFIWPGFVDALATLLLVVIFVLMFFMLGQFFLQKGISGRDEKINALSDQLAATKESLEDSENQIKALSLEKDNLSSDLDTAKSTAKRQSGQIEQQLLNIERLQLLKKELERQISQLLGEQRKLNDEISKLAERVIFLETEKAELTSQFETESANHEQRIAKLSQDLKVINNQLEILTRNMQLKEAEIAEKDIQLSDLNLRINKLLTEKVELLSKYRSEFFGRLRDIVEGNPDIEIVGDRFVFQSEVLFSSGSANIGREGKIRLRQFAQALNEISKKIPNDISWILRVDGHTDKLPISTTSFPSNWELSTARAVSVVKFLMEQGISPDRLAATGFGEFHPLTNNKDIQSLRKNRRIELKLTQR